MSYRKEIWFDLVPGEAQASSLLPRSWKGSHIYSEFEPILRDLLNSMLWSLIESKLHKLTFPLARPIATKTSFEYEGAMQRTYWYRVSDASSDAYVCGESSMEESAGSNLVNANIGLQVSFIYLSGLRQNFPGLCRGSPLAPMSRSYQSRWGTSWDRGSFHHSLRRHMWGSIAFVNEYITFALELLNWDVFILFSHGSTFINKVLSESTWNVT